MLIKRCSAGAFETTYRVYGGDRPGRTLMLLGGLGHLIFTPLVESCSPRYRIIVMDYPGLGAQEAIQPALDLEVALLARLVGAALDQENIPQAIIVGWSFGAQVAFELARLTPERIALLVTICGLAGRPFREDVGASPFIELRSAFPVALDWFTKRLGRVARFRSFIKRVENPSRLAKRFGLVDPATDEVLLNRVIDEFLSLDVDTYNRYTQAMADHDASEVLRTIPFPVLAIAGERDLFIEPARVAQMSKKLQRGEYFEVKGGTHYLPLEYSDLLALKIDDFVKRAFRR